MGKTPTHLQRLPLRAVEGYDVQKIANWWVVVGGWLFLLPEAEGSRGTFFLLPIDNLEVPVEMTAFVGTYSDII